MKKILFVLIVYSIQIARAQPPRRDTLFGLGWDPWHQQVTRVPVLLTPTLAKTIVLSEKLCFDKKIFVKANANGRVLDMYLFINTEDGYTGILSGKDGTLGVGDLKVDDPKFMFMVVSKKGNVYTYKNRKKKNGIEHYVSTGNSQTYLTQFGFSDGNDAIHKKTIRNIYCDNKFKTWSYKADGGEAPVFHVFGRTYPNKLVCKDFIGYSGVGYLQTDAGTYIACEMEKGSFFTEMRTFDDIEVCFDQSIFKHQEEEFYTDVQRGINKEREKTENADLGGDCASQKTVLNNYKKEMLNKKQRDLQTAQSGNVYQNQNTQKAYAGVMDPLDAIQQSIYEMDVKICKTEKNISDRNGRGTASLQERLSCYQRKKGELISGKGEMQAAETRYSNSPGQAFAEKTRIMSRVMLQGGCN